MLAGKALGDAARVYKKQFPDVMRFLLLQCVIRLMALTPLMLLFTPETRPWALLCVPALILLILPLRQNAAACMQCALRGGSLFQLAQVSFDGYFHKLLNGLKTGALLGLWLLPALAATGYAYSLWRPAGGAKQGVNDGITLLRSLRGLIGGDLVAGLVKLPLYYLATFLPFVVGLAFHSGTRHARALGNKKLLRGHRLGVMGAWLMGLVPLLPFFCMVAAAVARYVPLVLASFRQTLSLDALPSFTPYALVIGVSAAVLLLPLLPLRALVTAAYVNNLERKAGRA